MMSSDIGPPIRPWGRRCRDGRQHCRTQGRHTIYDYAKLGSMGVNGTFAKGFDPSPMTECSDKEHHYCAD